MRLSSTSQAWSTVIAIYLRQSAESQEAREVGLTALSYAESQYCQFLSTNCNHTEFACCHGTRRKKGRSRLDPPAEGPHDWTQADL